MYIAFYRWKLKRGMEQEFAANWREGTLLFRTEQKGWGSRLHKGDDGTYFAYAQWPDQKTYEEKRELSVEHRETLRKMSGCIVESYPPIFGEVTADLLLTKTVPK